MIFSSILDCQYEWEVFRGESHLLLEDDWKFGRALLLHPGKQKIQDHEVTGSIPDFGEIFFSKLQFHDKFVRVANSVLSEIKNIHLSRQKQSSKTGKTVKTKEKDFIFVGIHARGTDHIKYEIDRGFVPLKTNYYLDAMHLYRQHFK